MGFNEVLQKAVVDLENKREIYNEVGKDFEDVAYLEMRAAEERLENLIKEEKEKWQN